MRKRSTRPAPDDAPILYTRTEIAGILKCGMRKVDSLVLSGELGSITIGTRRLVTDDQLRAFLAKATDDGAGAW